MAEIIARNGNELTIQVTLQLTGSLLDMENTILDSCNEIGCLATTEALQKFDTDGSCSATITLSGRRTRLVYIGTDSS